jgi:hypothetical protein
MYDEGLGQTTPCVLCESGLASEAGKASCTNPLPQVVEQFQAGEMLAAGVENGLTVLSKSEMASATAPALVAAISLLQNWLDLTSDPTAPPAWWPPSSQLLSAFITAADALAAQKALLAVSNGLGDAEASELMRSLSAKFVHFRRALGVSVLRTQTVDSGALYVNVTEGDAVFRTMLLRRAKDSFKTWRFVGENISTDGHALPASRGCQFNIPLTLEAPIHAKVGGGGLGVISWSSPSHWEQKGLQVYSGTCGLDLLDIESGNALDMSATPIGADRVRIVVPITNFSSATSGLQSLQCVHWVDFAWSSVGCSVHSVLALDGGSAGGIAEPTHAVVCHCEHLSSEYAVAAARPAAAREEEPMRDTIRPYNKAQDDFFILVIFCAIGLLACMCCGYNVAIQRLHSGKQKTVEHAVVSLDRRATAHAVQLPGVTTLKGRDVSRAARSGPAADPHALLKRREQEQQRAASTRSSSGEVALDVSPNVKKVAV